MAGYEVLKRFEEIGIDEVALKGKACPYCQTTLDKIFMAQGFSMVMLDSQCPNPTTILQTNGQANSIQRAEINRGEKLERECYIFYYKELTGDLFTILYFCS